MTQHDDVTREPSGQKSHSTESSGKKPKRRWLRLLVWGVLLGGLLSVGGVVGIFWWVGRDLPDWKSLRHYRPWRTTKILALDQSLAMELAHQRRTVLAYKKFPKHLIQAVVAAEDGNFFSHKGLDYFGIMRAFWKNLWRRRGAPMQGGSTITQQVVKTFLLNPKQVYQRKIREAILARRIEQNLKKEEILYLYLNQIYFGCRRYGVEEASRFYFGKSANKLSLAESAILAGIPKNPERYNPVNSRKDTRRRRNYVLRRMLENGFIDKATHDATRRLPIPAPPSLAPPPFSADYYTETVRRRALEIIRTRVLATQGKQSKPGHKVEALHMLYRAGLRVETALDPALQRLAVTALQRGLRRLDKQNGYRGPIRHIPGGQRKHIRNHLARQPLTHLDLQQAIVLGQDARGVRISTGPRQGWIPWSSLRWAQRKPSLHKMRYEHTTRPLKAILREGDMIWVRPAAGAAPKASSHPSSQRSKHLFALEQLPTLQGALVAIEPATHRVRALVGGYDFTSSPFNRATQALRQPGSAFKPLVYGAALATHRYTPATMLHDVFFEAVTVDGRRWIPKNYTGTYSNKAISLRNALAQSVNTVAVRVLDRLGAPQVIQFAKQLGVRSPLAPYLPLALGASAVKPLELTNAYATFAAQGVYDDPVLITRILDAQGNVLYERLPNPRRAVNAGVAYLINSMLQDVVRRGTATAARQLKRPIAGKTGTTNEARNAWFIGYTPSLCVGVWLGYDNRTSLGRNASASRTALPIFIDFMRNATRNHHTRPFSIPEDIIFVKIDPQSGTLATPASPSHLFEAFISGTQPQRYAHSFGHLTDPGDFYKVPF